MATIPYFVFGPSTILSLLGLLHGPDKTPATPPEDWHNAKVDVVIPTLNEEETIVLCLASVRRQTLKPRSIILIDDASTDRTVERAMAFCAEAGVPLTVINRRRSIGKTPTIKRQARELDCDVEFVLDGDTVLDSPNYIERTVQELYTAAGIASACGQILPLRQRDRRRHQAQPLVQRFAQTRPGRAEPSRESRLRVFGRAVTSLYREVQYVFLQRFIYRGQMVFFGTITNPIGCAVAYRRQYVKNVFDYLTPKFGDDLTNSEDIFIGFALLNEGYRNIHVIDVTALTVEPVLSRLPRQVYSWSSSFLQSCYYFDALIRSPIKSTKRAIERWRAARARTQRRRAPAVAAAVAPAGVAPAGVALAGIGAAYVAAVGPAGLGGGVSMRVPLPAVGAVGEDRRVFSEPYRQAFGRHRTQTFGRPAAWMLLTGALEKVFFPTALLIMLLMRNWYGLGLTILIETSVALFALVLVTKGQRVEYFFKGLLVAPIRYAIVAAELVTLGRFASDIWLTQNRTWRK